MLRKPTRRVNSVQCVALVWKRSVLQRKRWGLGEAKTHMCAGSIWLSSTICQCDCPLSPRPLLASLMQIQNKEHREAV
jgi:hypothetical protein